MNYKPSKAEARILVVAKQNLVKDNYADMIGVKLNMNSSYVSGLIRRLELAGLITIFNSGKRRLINSVCEEAETEAKQILSEEKKE